MTFDELIESMPELPEGGTYRLSFESKNFAGIDSAGNARVFNIDYLITTISNLNSPAYFATNSDRTRFTYIASDFVNAVIAHCVCINDIRLAREWAVYRGQLLPKIYKPVTHIIELLKSEEIKKTENIKYHEEF